MGSIGIYGGADYGLNPSYKSEMSNLNPYFTGISLPSGVFGFPSNPQTSNQIDAVSKKISTGTQVIEVSGVSIGGGPPLDLIDNIPRQHFTEINRLKKLAGVELTFHGPLIEPTGAGQGNWTEQQRMQAERQMFSAVDRAHDLDPKGNIVVTFHASNGLPEPETIEKINGKSVVSDISVINERTGEYGRLPKTGQNYFLNEKKSAENELENLNKTNWTRTLNNLAIEAERARNVIDGAIDSANKAGEEKIIDKNLLFEEFNLSKKNPQEYNKVLGDLTPNTRDFVKNYVNRLNYGASFAQESYLVLQDAFNRAYDSAEKNKDAPAIKSLDKFREEVAPKTQKYTDDPQRLSEFVDEISKGINLLNSIKAPQVIRPIKEFALDKASDTFANIAFQSYEKFKHNDSSPIISIENPPVGMGLSRADELNELVKRSRNKFADQAVKTGLSRDQAEKQAEKLIGVTWDVGHINMIRKHGFSAEDTIQETKNIAKNVKHIHLSDNFGLEHTELPMGMGNVPIAEQEKALKKELGEKFKKVKQIVETGAWFRNFNNVTPFAETLQAFGSPIYPMKMASYWNQTRGVPGGYFSGYGRVLPDKHFSIYGAGFSTLPAELGGQVQGGSNRLSGAPME
jgi:sugar phosphate isomerase/epimerase